MLTDEQIERFGRQIILREVGVRGQERLLASRVLFVGLAPASSTALAYLAAAGVGEIGLVDDGRAGAPEAPLAFCGVDHGQARCRAAERLVAALQPAARAVAFAEGGEALASRAWDLAILAGASTAAALNLASIEARIPAMVLAVDGRRGWLAGIAGYRSDVPCWSCAAWAPWPEPKEADVAAAASACVLAGMVGSSAAIEAVKVILELGTPILGRILTWLPGTPAAWVTTLDKNPRCTACAREEASFAPSPGPGERGIAPPVSHRRERG
jgi:adenylyltransferase/sulfurtransferase